MIASEEDRTWSRGARLAAGSGEIAASLLPGEVDRLTPPPQQEQLGPFALKGVAAVEWEAGTAPPAAQCLPHHHVAVTAAEHGMESESCLQRSSVACNWQRHNSSSAAEHTPYSERDMTEQLFWPAVRTV